MNKKSQGVVGFVFHVIFFLIVVSIIGGTLFTLMGDTAKVTGLSGIELFVYGNFAVIFFVSAILGTMSFFYFGGGS